MPYTLEYLPAASKAIEKLPRALQIRILERLEKLSTNPRASGCVKLTGLEAY